jgi:ATP-dependent DNA helicase RecQ
MQHSLLKEIFGYSGFRPPQGEAISSILSRRDSLVIMPTGGGKSLCYQIPSLIFKKLTVVISPLISLMKDQIDQARALGIEARTLNSALPPDEYNENLDALLAGRVRLLYLAPETAMKPGIISMLKGIGVECLAIDEAHCISEWGHDFRPEYHQLSVFRKAFPDAVCAAFTATATPRVRVDIKKRLNFKDAGEFTASFNRPNLFYEVIPKQEPYKQVIEFLKNYRDESGIIYCFSRREVEKLSGFLTDNNFAALPYHAGLDDETRRRNQELFARDEVRIMAATIAFGMGIHKTNIRFVMHFDLPKSIESYYQETGRAGRDGLPARCLLLYGPGDAVKIKYFINQITDENRRASAAGHLDALSAFAETDECRRIPLLSHFGEKYGETTCGMCDNCTSAPAEQIDYTLQSQKLLSCIKRTGESFGFSHIIDILRGSESQKIKDREHHNLSTWNIGKEFTKKQWMTLGRRLMSKNILIQDAESFGSVKLTEKAYAVMKGEIKFHSAFIAAETVKASRAASSGSVTNFDHDLFNLLRTKRKSIAEAESVPPYIIFSDRSLTEMAVYYPRTEESFLEIHGVGRTKLERYGENFIRVIKNYCADKGLP